MKEQPSVTVLGNLTVYTRLGSRSGQGKRDVLPEVCCTWKFSITATQRSVILAFAELLPFKILSLDDSVVKPDRNGIIKDQAVLKCVATLPCEIS